jgi:ESCRT-I complex subunit TSG101
VLLLRGTLPMTYRGVIYNIPIDMYLPPPYPLRPPTVFVRPVASMAVKKNHKHVGMDGRVYMPYLHDWRPASHELRDLAVMMSSLFGSEPPCYAKQQDTAPSTNSHPPPYAQATTASSHPASQQSSAYSYNPFKKLANNAEEEKKRMALEKDIAEANLAAAVARQASLDEATAAAHQASLDEKRMHEAQQIQFDLNSMRARATSKAQFEVTTLLTGKMREELRLEMKNQKQLDGGKEQIENIVKDGEERKGALEKGHLEIDEATKGLEQWLAAVKAEEERSAANGDTKAAGKGEAKADLIALPADTHSAQMLALSAENAAIDDCIYFLDRALVRGNIPVEVFLKEVRKMSKQQFLVKVRDM